MAIKVRYRETENLPINSVWDLALNSSNWEIKSG